MKKTIFCQIVVMSFILLNQDIFALIPSGGFDLSNGNSIAMKDGKYGVLDPKDNIIIPFIYDQMVGYFNLVGVRIGDKYGIFDDYGNTIAPMVFDWLHILEGEGDYEEMEGIASARKDGVWYVLFRDGMCIPEEEWIKRLYRTYNIDDDGNVFYTDDRGVTF